MQRGDPCGILLCALPALTFHFARLKFLLHLLLGFPELPPFFPRLEKKQDCLTCLCSSLARDISVVGCGAGVSLDIFSGMGTGIVLLEA